MIVKKTEQLNKFVTRKCTINKLSDKDAYYPYRENIEGKDFLVTQDPSLPSAFIFSFQDEKDYSELKTSYPKLQQNKMMLKLQGMELTLLDNASTKRK